GISDVKPRPCANRQYTGKAFGSNAAAWWGFHYGDLLTDPKPREVITIYEVDTSGERNWAKAVYNFQWTPQTDPYGVVHKIIDYPGVPVDHRTVKEHHGVLKNVRIPIRPHFGVIGLAPSEADIVDSIPPHWVGGNIDDWRIGKGEIGRASCLKELIPDLLSALERFFINAAKTDPQCWAKKALY